MKTLITLILVLAAAASGWWFGQRSHSHDQQTGGRKVLFYQSPMHPWVKSDKPARCTICGMELSPIFEGDAGFDANSSLITLGKSGVTVAGIETAPVVKKTIRRTIRVAGMIDDDDSTHRRLSATAEGRVEKLFVNFVGAEVEAGQPLATLYSPALRTKFAELQSVLQQPASPQRTQLLAGIRERLLRVGLSAAEIDAASTSDKLPEEIKVTSPITGTVVARNVYEGQYVKEGDTLFEVGDFSKMWFVFDAYERDLAWIRMGSEIEVSTPALPGRTIRATITFIDPNLNMETRSARIRVVLDNPTTAEPGKHRHELLHKMYAEGRIAVETAPALTVPRAAVLWPAGKPVVYLEKGEGAYEPRDVQVGVAGDDVWEIAGGLREGDRVVTAGNLLLDGQSQINRPAQPPKSMLTDVQRKAALDFFTAFDGLGRALAADKPVDFRTAAAGLPAPLASLSAAFGSKVEKIVSSAKLDGTDLPAQRATFYPLSEAVAEFALTLRREVDGLDSVRIFACDMAKGNVPSAAKERGHWIQLTADLRNPWWGAEMLECGAEVRP
jgi:membrane fusion protein, copper/silver efflux system